MKNLISLITFLFLFISHLDSQVCLTYNTSSLVQDNGDGTCTYNVTLTVDSGNGASGTVTFSIDGSTVYIENSCTCNPTDITFPVTIPCGSSVDINVFYNAPGNGNDCNGSTGAIVLPVEWLDFDLSPEVDGVRINWSTASELNNNYFEVERSINGRNWVAISSKIEAAHYSNELNQYSYLDYRPQIGHNYYRVKQTDFDGHHSMTNTLEYYFENLGSSKVYPNPVEDMMFIKSAELRSWSIYTLQGVLIKNGNTEQINIAELNPGSYFIKVDSNSKFEYIKFLKL